ncbi:MAG: hypothetical protein L6R39_006326 [Caloplaca ligustica]|nr:MAG: hypothetical protein L6R39_006326 [Caloplaca ligustica]
MYLPTALLSIIVLAGGTLAQYGSGAGSGGYGTGSSDTGTGESMASGGSSSMPTSAPSPLAASPASAGAATPSGHVKVHVVKVSNKKGSLTFEPKNLQVAAGHMVQFQFYPKSHSVVQSTFDQPCQPIQNNMPSASGFFSGFMPVKAGAEMKPSYTIMVNDTKPICPAANQSRTIESFTALAKQATANLSPGQSASSASSSDGDSDGGSSSPGSSSSAMASSGSAATSAAAPAASGSGPSTSINMPLSGTNSSSDTTGAAAPSGSAGGQAPQSFQPGSGANALASGLGVYGSLGLAGVVSIFVAGML